MKINDPNRRKFFPFHIGSFAGKKKRKMTFKVSRPFALFIYFVKNRVKMAPDCLPVAAAQRVRRLKGVIEDLGKSRCALWAFIFQVAPLLFPPSSPLRSTSLCSLFLVLSADLSPAIYRPSLPPLPLSLSSPSSPSPPTRRCL